MPYRTKTGRTFKSKPGPKMKEGKRKKKKKAAASLKFLQQGRKDNHQDEVESTLLQKV